MEANVMECLGDLESWGSECLDKLDCLEWAGGFSNSCFPDVTLLVANKPCALFEVLGTEETWQGKHFHQICINGRVRGMLQLMRWPMVQILSNLSMSQLGMLAQTCSSFRKPALRALEEKAQELLVSRYFQDSHLIKFIDAFACFGWAMSLTESLTPATVAVWRAEELDAIFEHLVAFLQIKEESLLIGLQPEAARRWMIEGRKTLELFVSDCVTSKASFCKLLMHYDRAWLAIRKIMELNAKRVMAVLFQDSSAVVRKIKASWPLVTVEAEVAAPCRHDFDHDMSTWSQGEVYKWFRLKKMPMRGVLDLQPTGADLLQWIAHENTTGAPSRLSAMPPLGLGMSSMQHSRFLFLVNRVGLAKPRKTHAQVFTFRFAERVDSRTDTGDTADSAAAAPTADSTPCQSWTLG